MAQPSDGTTLPATTKSPNIETQSDSPANGVASVLRSALRSETATDKSSKQARDTAPPTAASNGTTNKLPSEAPDYLNGGIPHEGPKGILVNNPAPAAAAESSPSPTQWRFPPTTRDATASAAAGTSTPPGRRSVQFARSDFGIDSPHVRQDSWDTHEDGEALKDRRQSLMSKLKALASTSGLQTHNRSASYNAASIEEGTRSSPLTPAQERSNRFPHTLQEEDSDADAEETGDEGVDPGAKKTRRKRRMWRPQDNSGGNQTAPTTPRARNMMSADSPVSNNRPHPLLSRRATDGSLEQRGHLSEGEGRDRMTQGSAWRRGSSWLTSTRGMSSSFGNTPGDVDGTPSGRRPSNFRRAMTGFGGGVSDGDNNSPRRPFLAGERAATFGASRWRMLKHGLKLLGTKREEHRVDYLKSAELMAELRAGAPAALMLASMIQRDEHGNKRIPVLLEQLKISITDSKPSDEDPTDKERHLVFRIELEYGSGLNRMKWVIHRSLRDFANLHVRYKVQGRTDKLSQLNNPSTKPKQPHFPRSTFPYFRTLRGLGELDESEEDEADTIRGDETAGEASETDRRKKKTRRPSFSGRRKSTTGPDAATRQHAKVEGTKAYNEKQRRKLEQYLQEMIRWLIFRADSNRLCRFLELSALGVRLAAEGSYHGKEGFMLIQSSKGMDFRRLLTPSNVFARHSPKWFLVRHSYVVCVDSPENMHIYDVYLVDPKFEIQKKRRKITDLSGKEVVAQAGSSAKHPQHHSLKLQNSERRIKLLAKNERQLRQFEESLEFMMENTAWAKPNRFESFAPVRTGVYAQWLVDGRDYMWNVSRAISMAKDVIYIHDWWLSPQLYMRRPAAISQKWRLDRLLQRKAREGVKVFIIIYRNVEAAIPIDSEFTKFSMLDLHPNIFVQRSPNQFKKNQFFFAHHEKICIVDHTVAFVGGIDLCFGRWDTPQHSVVDDKPTGFEPSDLPKDSDHCQLWPGKDYSNPRVQDFYQLNEPYAEMYDRSKVPRMPWHDISMQVVGQPARDLTRHFVQRWNYVLRGRKPTRPTPFLLPPPDYTPADLEALGLTGTCEVQILRSASDWSLGLTETEHSIMTAYCKMIEESEHFVYMENQFYISSSETMNVKIINKIGDAIVERAIRAYRNNESWKCVILIPLMPGFQNTVDQPEGTSVRLIMQCQFRSICRGEGSIFGRLRAQGIEPEDFVQFYSLRSWGRIGPKKTLVTEQLYIHAKVIIVDDRIALIGSANINERSMLGSRDSECAAVVRDTDMLWSTMDGEPYLVGRFAHTLRMRLMREHLGLHVDDIMENERRAELDKEEELDRIYGDGEDADTDGAKPTVRAVPPEQGLRIANSERSRSFNHDADWEEKDNPNLIRKFKEVTHDKRVTGNKEHAAEVDGEGPDNFKSAEDSGLARGRDSRVIAGGREVLVTNIAPEGKGTINRPKKPHTRISPQRHEEEPDTQELSNDGLPPMPPLPRQTTEQLGLLQLSQLPILPTTDDTDIGGPPALLNADGKFELKPFNPLTADIKIAPVDQECMRDPLNDTFFEDIWRQIAENNTKIFRRVFRCNPDSEVTNWHEYTEYFAYAERFAQAQAGVKSTELEQQESTGKSGPPGAGGSSVGVPGTGVLGQGLSSIAEKVSPKSGDNSHPKGTAADWAENASKGNTSIEPVNAQYDGANDEKAALRGSDEAISNPHPAGSEPFPALESSSNPPADAEKAADNTTRRATFASATPSDKSSHGSAPQNSVKRRRRGTTKGSRRGFAASDELLSTQDAEELLGLVQGHLVLFPYDWLIKEELNSNWLYQVDQVAPLQIYD